MTRMTVSDIVAGAVAVILGAGVIVMLPGSTVNAFHAILVATIAILLSGLAQERYKDTRPL